MSRWIYVALVGVACGNRGEPRGPASPPPPADAMPIPRDAVETATAIPAMDISVASAKTSAGGEVIELGRPRMRIVERFGELELRGNRAFAIDRGVVKIFDLDTGELVQRAAVDAESLVVSNDATWIAAGNLRRTSVLKAPFDRVELEAGRGTPCAFIGGGLVMDHGDVFIIDLATKQRRTGASTPSTMATLGVAAGATGLDWLGDGALLRWDYGSKVTVVAKAPTRWRRARIARRARVAIVADDNAVSRLDLATGQLSELVTARFVELAISPSGRLFAMSYGNQVVVRDSYTGAELHSIAAPANEIVGRLAFGSRDEVIAYGLEGEGALHVYDLATGERRYSAPSRFRGWAANAFISERDGVAEQIALPSLERSPAPASAPPAPGAPSWATWTSRSPSGDVIAAEPSRPHELLPDHRWKAPCAPTLRVWTPKGGERTFSLVPTQPNGADLLERTDPCWRIEGGLVVAATMRAIAVFDPVTGAQLARLDPGAPPFGRQHPDFAHEYWEVAVSPTGEHLALWWRRVDEFPPGEPGRNYDLACTKGRHGRCIREYFAEVWKLGRVPWRRWQARFDGVRPPGRSWPLSRVPSGPIAFTPDGASVLFGFDDGEIVIRSVSNASAPARRETLHRDPVSRIEVSPDGRWVFSEDLAGEQRVWPL